MKTNHVEKIAGTVLLVVCLCVFSGVAKSGFINFDDGPYVYGNPRVQAGLTIDGAVWAFKTIHASNWHPVTWLSHMLDCELYGLNPAGHHLTNLFFHITNSLLLLLLLRNATGRFWESFFVACLFALHPLRVESVAWVSERKDVLSTFFGLLTMLSYVQYARQPHRSGYLPILLFFSLGLMAKPMLVTLPFVLLLLDFWPLHRWQIRKVHPSSSTFSRASPSSPVALSSGALLLEKMPLLVLSAAASVATFIAQFKGGAVSPFEVIPLKIRFSNALVACWLYLEKIFWPHDLAAFYPHPGNRLPLWQAIACGLFLAASSLLAIQQTPRRPFLLTGWFWFLGMLVPVLGIIQVGAQAMADRYTYLPSVGVFIIVVWTLRDLPWRVILNKYLLAAGFALVMVSLSLLTWIQTGYWKNTETLFRHAVSVTFNNHVAHTLLGNALASEGKTDLAQVEYEKALALWPQNPEAHNNLGMLLAKRGLTQEAKNHYEEALRIKPKYASAHINMASLLAEQGDIDAAVLHYEEALRIDPDAGDANNGLGVVMARMQRMDEAVSYLSRAIASCPRCAEPHNNLGRVLTLRGNFERAANELQQAIELCPKCAEAYNNMGLLYLQIGALEEALYYVASALHLKEDYGKARSNLREIALRIAQSGETYGETAANVTFQNGDPKAEFSSGP
jgi:Flp pilus assembly protein TadD